MNRLQFSIGEWLRAHEENILVFFRSWSRYFSFMYFQVFFDKLSNKLLGLFCLFVSFFPDETAFSSILRIKTIFFGRHSIRRGYTDHIWRAWYNGSYIMMAKPIKTLELHYPMIQFLIIIMIILLLITTMITTLTITVIMTMMITMIMTMTVNG